jgi:ankyrin repeat protein
MVEKKVSIVHFLLKSKKLRVSEENTDGDTPLHWAANSYNRRMSLLLIINGANHLKKNNKGEIPGDGGKIEMKMLNRKIYSEHKCFKKLPDF